MQKARIKLTGKDPQLLDDICKEIKIIAEKAGVNVSGPIPLPTKHLKISLMKTPCGDGMHRGGGGRNWERWELRIHRRLLDIGISDRVMKQLMRIKLPADVDIEIKVMSD